MEHAEKLTLRRQLASAHTTTLATFQAACDGGDAAAYRTLALAQC